MNFSPENFIPPGANIKVIGVGGGGGNAINTMIRAGLDGVEFISANTDVQALRFSMAQKKIQLGRELTKGLGAGADPDVGRDAALEDRHSVQEALTGADMVFITAGMGGGTGTGGASVVAQIAREMGALTVAVVTKPFNFEGKRRKRHAEAGTARLRECVDTLITIPNQRLLQIASPQLSMIEAFRLADNVLLNAVRGISDIINIPGTVNVDFADVKTVMSSMGMALMGIGAATGENRAVEAAKQAISSPLLEDIDIEGATGILINITAGADVSLMEVNDACSVIQEAAHEDANIIFGAVIDEQIGNEIRVTVIATGFPCENEEPTFHERESSYAQPTPKPSSLLSRGSQVSQPKVTVPVTRKLEQNLVPEPKVTADPFSGLPQRERDKPELDAPTIKGMSLVQEAQDLAQLTLTAPSKLLRDEPKEMSVPAAPPAMTKVEIQLTGASLIKDPDDELLGPELAKAELEAPVGEQLGEGEEKFNFPSFDPEPLTEDATSAENSGVPETNDVDESLNLASKTFDRKIDEALEIAERLKASAAANSDSDNLDVPAFLRHGMKDLALS